MPSKKKKYNARFPPARIKKIMQTDDEVGKVAAAVPVIISRALELFVEALITKANDITQARNAKTLTTSHLKQCILAETKFDFLKDLVASVQDIQVEDETSNSSASATPILSSGQTADERVPNAKSVIQRVKRTKEKVLAEGSAGPSNSDEDDSDEQDAEEDDDDDDDEDDHNTDKESNNRHATQENTSLVQPSTETNITRFALMATTNSDDEDYDS